MNINKSTHFLDIQRQTGSGRVICKVYENDEDRWWDRRRTPVSISWEQLEGFCRGRTIRVPNDDEVLEIGKPFVVHSSVLKVEGMCPSDRKFLKELIKEVIDENNK